jgi:hypothetical protein
MKDALYDEMDVAEKPLPAIEREDPNYYWFPTDIKEETGNE